MSAAESFTPEAAEALRVLRVVWRNAPASVYVAYTHIFCTDYDEGGECLESNSESSESDSEGSFEDSDRDLLQPRVLTAIHGVHLTAAAATAQAREAMRGTLILKPELLRRMSEELGFCTGLELDVPRTWLKPNIGERVWAASVYDDEACRHYAASVYKTWLQGVTKQRAEALTR